MLTFLSLYLLVCGHCEAFCLALWPLLCSPESELIIFGQGGGAGVHCCTSILIGSARQRLQGHNVVVLIPVTLCPPRILFTSHSMVFSIFLDAQWALWRLWLSVNHFLYCLREAHKGLWPMCLILMHSVWHKTLVAWKTYLKVKVECVTLHSTSDFYPSLHFLAL